jgi:hypothetical protein
MTRPFRARGWPAAGQAAQVPLQAADEQPAAPEAQTGGLVHHHSITVMDIGPSRKGRPFCGVTHG